jgi:hypothetical protein
MDDMQDMKRRTFQKAEEGVRNRGDDAMHAECRTPTKKEPWKRSIVIQWQPPCSGGDAFHDVETFPISTYPRHIVLYTGGEDGNTAMLIQAHGRGIQASRETVKV